MITMDNEFFAKNRFFEFVNERMMDYASIVRVRLQENLENNV